MAKWIPFPFYHDDVPVDISFVFAEEKPAGKHGFLRAEGRSFVFEDGTKATFWGTNFNGACCFPDHDYARILARRLAKIGINLVRFHQLDAEWHTPNIFAFTRGKRLTGGKLDPTSMDRLDYLIACLKEEGIYCYLDMLTYRKFKSDEGIENAHLLGDGAKPYCMYNRRLIELQKEFCRDLWCHQNPYTGLKYADDPVFVMSEILNECDLFARLRPIRVEPYRSEFAGLLESWLQKQGNGKKAEDFDLDDYEDETLIAFKTEVQEAYYREMIDCMRECGVKIPIAGNNWPTNPANLRTQLVTDFYDIHPYLYDFKWKEFEKRNANRAITKARESFLTRCAYTTSAHMPTFASEWDVTWPNEYRAEAPVYLAAVGNLQGWSGFAIHTYAYSSRLAEMKMLGRELSPDKLGNGASRPGSFSAWNDPARYGLFYHAALITRRGDVARAKNTLTFRHASAIEMNPEPVHEYLERSAVIFDASDLTPIVPAEKRDHGEVRSDTGELYRSWQKHYGTIDTPKTKCAYGFLGKNGKIELSGMKITCETDFATIAASVLEGEDMEHAANILLTAVGRAQNTGFRQEGELMLEEGHPPVCIEVIEAEIELQTRVEGLVVYAVSAEGYDVGTVPAVWDGSCLRFRLGQESRSMYYRIVKE